MFFYCWYLIAIDHFHDDIDDENANDPTVMIPLEMSMTRSSWNLFIQVTLFPC